MVWTAAGDIFCVSYVSWLLIDDGNIRAIPNGLFFHRLGSQCPWLQFVSLEVRPPDSALSVHEVTSRWVPRARLCVGINQARFNTSICTLLGSPLYLSGSP